EMQVLQDSGYIEIQNHTNALHYSKFGRSGCKIKKNEPVESYKKFLEKGAGHEPEQIITVDEYISAYNPCNDSSREIEFSQIKHIYENKDIFVLITEAKLGIIITKCGFTSGDSEDFKNYLYENAKNAKAHK
ncbi:MAG: YcxB family protein, partial [Oscillospiraceae bacterium]